MIAVIETGGKQYVVEPGTKLTVERLAVVPGDMAFEKVLLVADGATVEIGAPYLANRTVAAHVVGDVRGKRKIIFRFHSKTRYRKYKTHRQPYTEVAIVG
ncbi:MAG: 50S ribosomal protein L21 [bacterium]|nr:50S ribosomal protein L21 [bacterium]